MDDNCGEWVECMGVASGCGCKEVYRFPHTTYPYSSCICSFLQQHPYFLFLMFFVLVIIMSGLNACGLQSRLLITPLSE